MIITVNIPKRSYVTNGDVIKALFNGQYGTNGDYVHVFGVGGNGCLTFTKEWWNTKYTLPEYEEAQKCKTCKFYGHSLDETVGTDVCYGCVDNQYYRPKVVIE